MKKCVKLFYAIVFILTFNFANAQNISNEGADFWLPFPTHDPRDEDLLANLNVFVTCRFDSRVTVSCGGTYSETKTIPANTIVAFSVPRDVSYITNDEGNQLLTNRAIHVVTAAGQPDVAVYAHIYAGNRSAASLISPVQALGQKYYSMNFTQDNEGNGFLVLVATEDNTSLLLHTLSGTVIPITLAKAGDVYEYLATPGIDLTGTFVEVDPATSNCKRFAAFSGSSSNSIVCSRGRDPLLQQLYSLNNWGKSYGIVPFASRRHILRVLAQEDQTKVNVNGSEILLNKGAFYESPILTEAGMVTANKLISVAQYSLSEDCSAIDGSGLTGDPEMILLNPIEFNIKKITVFSSDNLAIQEKYINVFMKTAQTSTFTLNGEPLTGEVWQRIPSDPTYSYVQIPVYVESLTLSASDGFNAIAYGFGQYESYGYSAGTSLAASTFLTLLNKTTNVEGPGGCVNQPVDFRFTVPYALSKITWKVGNAPSDIFEEFNPVATTTIVNGETRYTYSWSPAKIYTTPGKKNVSIMATLNAAASVCSNNNIEFTFTPYIFPKPIPEFEYQETTCTGNTIAFKDKSESGILERPINKWRWNFGDGTEELTTQNPTHAFATPGEYDVKLYAGTDEGCAVEVKTHRIVVLASPKASFSGPTKGCVESAIMFVDQSTSADGAIIKYTWDFGDGSFNGTQTPPHTFKIAGTYVVKLTVTSSNGCVSDVFTHQIEIEDLPTPDFELPEVCVNGEAVFKNLSLDADGTTVGLTYVWTFDDPASGVLNTSTDRNAIHKFSVPRVYKVTLTTVSKVGCVASRTKAFTVNGASPVADFKIAASVCGNRTFTAENTSTVDFGNVTRLEWYIDNVPYAIDEEPSPGKIYEFAYPIFMAPASKEVEIKLIAFSGSPDGPCKDEKVSKMTIFASPKVEFSAIAAICVNGGAVNLRATELSGLPGNGVFSGPGVSTMGNFNPVLARVGLHQLTYTYTTNNGCVDSKSVAIEVFAKPEVDAGGDFSILTDGEKRIEARATGRGLSYRWSPIDGLSDPTILNPIVRPKINTKYTLTVTSDQGCVEVDDIYVTIVHEIVVPNAFSPNGDGINDVWEIKYLNTYPNSTVEVFNRAGTRVFQSLGYRFAFDGTYRGAPLPVATYYYLITPNRGRKRITGDLTIIR